MRFRSSTQRATLRSSERPPADSISDHRRWTGTDDAEPRNRRSRPVLRGRRAHLFLHLLLLVMVVFGVQVSQVHGDDVDPQAVPADLGSGIFRSDEPLTDVQAAREMPHSDLDREEAMALLESVFQPILEGPAGPFDDLEAERLINDQAAIVSGDERPESPGIHVGPDEAGTGPEKYLLESSIPLSEDGEVIDLSLQDAGSSLESVNPLVHVEVPEHLGDGIVVGPEEVSIELVGAPEDRAPSLIDSAAVYPNVATDTDLIVAPSPTGVETFTALRSPAAGTGHAFKVEGPAGSELRPVEGGAALVVEEQRILVIHSPAALDAAGAEVPVEMTVEDEGVSLTIDPVESVQYPVLVDPLFESFSWPGMGSMLWEPVTTDSFWMPLQCCQQGTNGQISAGLAARALGATYSPSSNAHWERAVPRYHDDVKRGYTPTSFISSFTLSGVQTKSSSGPSSPYPYAGIWDPALGNWAGKDPYRAIWAREGNLPGIIGGTISLSAGGDKQAQIAVGPGMHVNEYASIGGPREMVAGGATVEIGDEDSPSVSNPIGSEIWANQTAKAPIAAVISDSGLGAKRAIFHLPGQGDVTITNSCLGTAPSPCPAKWSAVAGIGTYNPALMPQGWLSIPVDGEDLLGHRSPVPAVAEIGIDHTPPTLSPLTGSLTEQKTLGTRKAEYKLRFSAADGYESAPALQKSFTGLSYPIGVAADKSGNILVADWQSDRINKFNQAGELIGQIGSPGSGNGQLSGPCMLAVDAAGNVWVTETKNRRVQVFSPGGAYLRQFKDPSVEFPYGIAITPAGKVWISDAVKSEVIQLQESSGSLTIARRVRGGIAGSADTTFLTPTGLASDAQGNIWVADTDHHRLQMINPGGEIVRQIGSLGSGRGQFRQPFGVAVTELGHLVVSDSYNSRLQVLDDKGTFLRAVGGPTQFKNPAQIVFVPGNTAFVADWTGARVQKWANVDLDSQSGVVKSEVLVDGVLRETFKPTCSGQTVCALPPHDFALQAASYAEGKHSAQVVVTDAVGLTTSSPEMSFEVHPDRTPPQITWTGSMTEQATLGSTRPAYTLQVQASDPEPAEGSLVFSSSVWDANGVSLVTPVDAAVDPKGDYWLTDSSGRLLKYSGSTSILQAGSVGSGAGQYNNPTGVAIDPSGNLWVADTGNNRVLRFDAATGAFISTFGKDVNKTKVAAGAAEGERNLCTAASGDVCQAGVAGGTGAQLKAPRGVAAAATGPVWVADTGNGRVKRFNPTGGLLDNFGGEGAEPGKLKEPKDLAVGADGSIWVADTGNHRIAQWNSSGIFVKIFGAEGSTGAGLRSPGAIEAGASGRLWVADSGNARVKAFSETGALQISYGTLQPSGDTGAFKPVGLALDGKAGLYVVDNNNHRVQHWTPTNLSQSGVVSSMIKVDGNVVDSYNPGCSTENCTLSREWTLKANSFSVGTHTVQVTVADGAGLFTSKTLNVSIQRDTTPPTVTSTGPLAEAPEGWVEQKTYSLTATSTDPNGFGVKQIRLLIDGTLVGESANTSCEPGGCSKAKIFNVGAAAYKGGAHDVAVVAEDGAGNWKKQSWTMNVDPQGAVSAGEATDTLEAMEETVPSEEEFMPVASTGQFLEPAIIEAGDNPHFHWEEGKIASSGVTVDTEFDPASDLLTIEGTEGPIELSPAAPISVPAITENAAAVLPSTSIGADTVIRPEYNGAFMFTTVRDGAAPEQYVWHVKLNPGQYLAQYDSQHIQVISKTGTAAWLISATAARDATGQAVPTTISIVGGSDIVLHLPHRGKGLTYPISAGQSYETGYALVTSHLVEETPESEGEEPAPPPPASDIFTEAEAQKVITSKSVGPETIPAPEPSSTGGASASSVPEKVVKPFKRCSSLGCGVWWVELRNPSYHYKRNASGRLTAYWQDGTQMHGESWRPWYYLPELNAHLCGGGFFQPYQVWAGEQRHLTVWLRSKITAHAFTFGGDVLDFDNRMAMQIWVWPNGFQQRWDGHWDVTPEWIESGGACAIEEM